MEGSKFVNLFHPMEFVDDGSCAIVVKARHKLDKQVYAVKIIQLKNPTDFHSELCEAELMATLEHENIARYHQVWLDNHLDEYALVKEKPEAESCSKNEGFKFLCIQMSFYPSTLFKMMCSGCFDFGGHKTLKLFREIVSGVNYLHGLGIIHGDLTERNIFVDDIGKMRIGDFGHSRVLNDVGVPKVSIQGDMSALGVILFNISYEDTIGDAVVKLCDDKFADEKWIDDHESVWELIQKLQKSKLPSAKAVLDELDELIHK